MLAHISFGVPAAVSGTPGGVGFYSARSGANVSPVLAFDYMNVGEALYQDVHAAVDVGTGNITVIDVFEADEIGPDHYAKQRPQLWETRPVRAVAL